MADDPKPTDPEQDPETSQDATGEPSGTEAAPDVAGAPGTTPGADAPGTPAPTAPAPLDPSADDDARDAPLVSRRALLVGGITAGALLLGGAGGYLLGSGRAARTAGAACTPSAGTTLLTSTPDAPSYARASRSTAVRSSSSVRSP